MKTDNGPPWNGHDMAKFSKDMGFKHRKITPLHPQSSAEAERFISTIGKTTRAAQVENKNWKQEMYGFSCERIDLLRPKFVYEGQTIKNGTFFII